MGEGHTRVFVADVGEDPGEVGLADKVLQHVQAKVKLMVAYCGCLDAQLVQNWYHLVPLAAPRLCHVMLFAVE